MLSRLQRSNADYRAHLFASIRHFADRVRANAPAFRHNLLSAYHSLQSVNAAVEQIAAEVSTLCSCCPRCVMFISSRVLFPERSTYRRAFPAHASSFTLPP